MELSKASTLVHTATEQMAKNNPNPYFNMGRLEMLLAMAISEDHGKDHVCGQLLDIIEGRVK